jgi:hypothetical protein
MNVPILTPIGESARWLAPFRPQPGRDVDVMGDARLAGPGVSLLTLQAGSVIVLRHRSATPPEGKTWLRTGV